MALSRQNSTEEEQALFPDHTASREVGTTTGRKRRIGWFDAFLLRHTICSEWGRFSGFD